MARFELQKLYIDGGYSDAGSDATFEAINPANGEVLALVQRATKEDVERAVVSAEKGQKIWAAMTAMERSMAWTRAFWRAASATCSVTSPHSCSSRSASTVTAS